jgi:hypothetical protein
MREAAEELTQLQVFGNGQMVTFQNMSFGDGQMVNFQNMSGEPVFSKVHTRRTSKICVPSQKACF